MIDLMAPRTRTNYEELEVIALPEDIPELGIQAGYLGTVDHTYPVRDEVERGLNIEVNRRWLHDRFHAT